MEIYFYTYFLIIVLFYLNKIKIFRKVENYVWILLYLFFLIFIGLRFEVGGDWNQYLKIFNSFDASSFTNIFATRNEFGFNFLIYFVKYLKLDFIHLNFICSLIIISIVFFYLRKQDDPFLGLIIIYTLFVIIFVMGFIRQSVSASIVILSIYYLQKNRIILSYFWIIISCTFHISAIIFLVLYPLSLLINFKYNHKQIFILLFFIFMGVILFLFIRDLDIYKSLTYNYLGKGRFERIYDNPSGAPFRVLVNIIPSFLILFFIKKFQNIDTQSKKIFITLSILCLLISATLFFYPVFVDRYMYYFIILQIIFYSNLSYNIENKKLKIAYEAFIISYYLLIFLVWINYADHKRWWIPYKISENLII